jgi:hypothetical protein
MKGCNGSLVVRDWQVEGYLGLGVGCGINGLAFRISLLHASLFPISVCLPCSKKFSYSAHLHL